MSAGYASRLKEYPHKGVCGLPETRETSRSYKAKRRRLLELVQDALAATTPSQDASSSSSSQARQEDRKRSTSFRRRGGIVVLTGAGISTAAGIPDFRGPKGIWTLEQQERKRRQQQAKRKGSFDSKNQDISKINNKRYRKDKMDNSLEPTVVTSSCSSTVDPEIPCTPSSTPDQNDDSVASMDFGQARPTLTHRALYYLTEVLGWVRFCVTQNVDGLHRRSGMRRERLAILHGCVFTEKCQDCCLEHFRETDVGGMSFQPTGRYCNDCNSPLRDTLLDWKDPLPDDDYQRSLEYCKQAALVLCLGTSLRIEPAGSLPTLAEKFVIVNLQATPYDEQAHLIIHSKVDQVLEDLMHDWMQAHHHDGPMNASDSESSRHGKEWNVDIDSDKIQLYWKNPSANLSTDPWWQTHVDADSETDSEERVDTVAHRKRQKN